MSVYGVDPGRYGAIAILQQMRLSAVHDSPTLKAKIGKTSRDVFDLDEYAAILKVSMMQFPPAAIWIEDVGGITGQSCSAAFTFGETCGQQIACLRLLAKAPFSEVTPQAWQKEFKIKGKKSSKDRNDMLLARVRELFPYASEDLWFGPAGGFKDGRAEAALLALYGARRS